MTVRALIIAIEDYSQSTSLARQLPGTNQGAESFRDWLISKKGAQAADILGCAGPGCAWRTAGTTRKEIIGELLRLGQDGQDNTAELYFFFSGHGFSYLDSPWTSPTDVLVASDFIDLDQSGGACLKLQEVQQRLWNALGPGDHYYFVDACRNPIREGDIQVLGLGMRFPTSVLGKPTVYTLYSTAQGVVAKVNSGFANLLVKGLSGSGRAKRWEESTLYVTFEALVDYVKKQLKGQEVEPDKRGPGKGLILEIIPVPESPCEVKVENAEAGDTFTLEVSNHLGLFRQLQFQGDSCQVTLRPYDYFFRLTHATATVVQVAPPPPDPLDLYDPCLVRFRKETAPQPPAPAPPPLMAALAVEAAPSAEVSLEDLAGGTLLTGTGELSGQVFPGTYQLKMREGGVTIESQRLTIKPGQKVALDLLAAPKSKVRENILKAVPGRHYKRLADFSESLGPVANWDLGLWLSLIGASRLVRPSGVFSKLSVLPLESFQDVTKDKSVMYVLAGFEQTRGKFQVGLSTTAEVKWRPMRKIKSLTGIYERRLPAAGGFHLLSFKIPGQAPLTLASYCLPNRATLVTFAEDAQRHLKVHQYLLPIHSLSQYLDPEVQQRLQPFINNPLKAVRTMALAQSQFARNRPMCPPPGSEEWRNWDDLMHGKWLDPIMSLIAAYEIIRRGQLKEYLPWMLEIMGNLRKYFQGIPDIEVMAKLIGSGWTKPPSPPLLLDGLLAVEELEEVLPLSLDKIDYKSSWVTWRGAVKD